MRPLPATSPRSRWLPTLAAFLLAGLCLLLGQWQWGKAERKQAQGRLYAQAGGLPELDWAGAQMLGVTALYRRVHLEGEFIWSYRVWLDNRVRAGRAGYHLVVPLHLTQGDIVLVNRGWRPVGADRQRLPELRSPSGRQQVVGILVPAQGRYLELGGLPDTGRLWQNLDMARYRAWFDAGLPDLLLLETGTARDGLVRDWPPPDLGAERNRAYAVQWLTLAVLSLGLWGYFSLWNRGRAQ